MFPKIMMGFVTALILLVVAVMVWLTFVRGGRFRRLAKRGRLVDGTVVQRPTYLVGGDGSGSGGALIHIVVEFTDDAGIEHRTESRGATPYFPDVGGRVRVAFETGRPETAIIDADARNAGRIGKITLLLFVPMLVASTIITYLI